jgi:hypothetical protein
LFRSRIRLWAALALFALAVQLVASFGHIHADELFGPQIETAAAPSGDDPGSQHHDGDHDAICNICATLSVLSSGQVAAPPLLVVPVAFVWIAQPIRAEAATFTPRLAAFRSRAPPTA